ncbi:MAG TPA: lysophospholipid acyltransferase family protein [Candidatus Contendobacter sp.]|nr:lysophospholipid acyltransferase family protein [Candidatus Contendobacter sp.]
MSRHGPSRLARAARRSARLPRLLLHVLIGILIAAALGPGRRRYVSTRPLRWWSRGLCRIMGIEVRASGIACDGAALFVANHISWLDIFCIAAVCPTQFLAKQEVADWPLFGWLCRRAGTAFIRRGGDHGASEATEHLVWRLRQGERVLVFPEGTSTTGETVRRFHPRLFQAAILARCPVQTIALRYPQAGGLNPVAPFVGDDALLPHLWRLLGEPGLTVELRFGAVRFPPHSSRDALARQTHAEISALTADAADVTTNAHPGPSSQHLLIRPRPNTRVTSRHLK